MNIIKKYWQGILCLCLAFVCLFSLVYSFNVNSAADSGGSLASSKVPKPFSGGTTSDDYISYYHTYRLGIVPLSNIDFSEGSNFNNNSWVNIDDPYQYILETCGEDTANYFNPNGWAYLSLPGANLKDRLYDVGGNALNDRAADSPFYVSVEPNGDYVHMSVVNSDPGANNNYDASAGLAHAFFTNIRGLSTADTLDDVSNVLNDAFAKGGYVNWTSGTDPVLSALLDTYNYYNNTSLTQEDAFIIVFELVGYYHKSTYNVYFPVAKFKTADNTVTWKGKSSNKIVNSTNYIKQGKPLFGGAIYEHLQLGEPVPDTHAIYGNIERIFGVQITGTDSFGHSANIQVQYNGIPNTTDAGYSEKFSLSLGKENKMEVWNGNGWGSSDVLLVQEYDTSSEASAYEIVKASTGTFTVNGTLRANIFATGSTDEKLKFSWKGIDIDANDINVGKLYEFDKVYYGSVDEGAYALGYAFAEHRFPTYKETAIGVKYNKTYEWSGSLSFSKNTEEVPSIVGTTGGNNAIRQACQTVFETASGLSDLQAISYNYKMWGKTTYTVSDGYVTHTYTNFEAKYEGDMWYESGKNVGVGLEVIVKNKRVYDKHYRLVFDKYGDPKSSEIVKEIDYWQKESGSFDLSKDIAYYVILKRTDDTGDTHTNYNTIKSLLNDDIYTVDDIKNKIGSYVNSNEVHISGTNPNASLTVGLGCTPDIIGYDVIEIVLEPPTSGDPKEFEGEVYLPEYMLNKYINDIVNTSYRNAFYGDYRDPNAVTKNYSALAKKPHNDLKLYVHKIGDANTQTITYNIEDVSSGSNNFIISLDNGSLSKHYYLSPYSNGYYTSTNARYTFIPKMTLSYSKSDSVMTSGTSARRIEYGFNLVRGASGVDVKTYSGISYGDAGSGDTGFVDLLRMQFGVVPTGDRKRGNSKNSYSEWYSDHVEHLELTGSTDGKLAFQSLVVNEYPTNKIDYYFNVRIEKYYPTILAQGTNSNLDEYDKTFTDMDAKLALNTNGGAISKDKNEYRFASVISNDQNIDFYPENLMAYRFGGTKLGKNTNSEDDGHLNSSNYNSAYVISSELRSLDSSTLYLFKLNTTNENNNNTITGSVYSDSMQGGSGMLGQQQVAIPAGSDVTVLADAKKVTFDLYGYALDLVNKEKDKTMRVAADKTYTYTNVVRDNSFIGNIWNNNKAKDISDKLFANFTTWCNNMLTLENYAADFELWVNGSEKAQNFDATIGKVNKTTPVEDGVYNIVVKGGVLVTPTTYPNDPEANGYKYMINQIVKDYDLANFDEGEQLFKNSGVYTAIINAIESATDDYNNSGVAQPGSTAWTSVLNNTATQKDTDDENWYDEKVQTFVIRRYKCTGNTLSDITATDKIDLGLGATSNGALAGMSRLNAEWKLNIFFNPNSTDIVTKNLLGADKFFYNPSNNGLNGATVNNKNFNDANSKYSVLINGNHVDGADFTLPAQSTGSFND